MFAELLWSGAVALHEAPMRQMCCTLAVFFWCIVDFKLHHFISIQDSCIQSVRQILPVRRGSHMSNFQPSTSNAISK